MTNAAIIISNMEILITEGTIKPENEINTWYGWKGSESWIVKAANC